MPCSAVSLRSACRKPGAGGMIALERLHDDARELVLVLADQARDRLHVIERCDQHLVAHTLRGCPGTGLGKDARGKFPGRLGARLMSE